jgi:hypothetical protein
VCRQDQLELRDRFEVLRATGGSLDLDEFLETEALARVTEDRKLDTLGQELLEGSTSGDLAK